AAQTLSLAACGGSSRSPIPTATPRASITEFTVPTPQSLPSGITAGPDGALWFTEALGHKIGRISTSGAITEFPLPAGASLSGIATGPDGALWFTEALDMNSIGRMMVDGALSQFPLPTSDSQPFDITMGPDGNLWFTESHGNRI